MKKQMRKTALAAAFICAVAALSGGSGCLRLTGNDRSDTNFLLPVETQDAEYYLLDENIYAADYLKRDKRTGDFSLERIFTDGDKPFEPQSPEYGELWTGDDGTDYSAPVPPVVMDTGRWSWGADLLDPEYESLYALLRENYLGSAKSLRCYAAVYSDGIAYGYCHGYNRGVSFSSGSCAVEEIAFSVHFSYDADTDELTELGTYDGCNIVACWADSVIYYRDQKYYYCREGEETYLCDDDAYDYGPTWYSHALFLYNEEYALLYFTRRLRTSTNEYDVIVVCDRSGDLKLNFRNDEPLTKLRESDDGSDGE